MNRNWHRIFGSVAVGLMLAVPVGGCAGRPAPRPESASNAGAIRVDAAVTDTAAATAGAGPAASVVIGNVVLAALQLGGTLPGGTAGGLLTGNTTSTRDPNAASGAGTPGSGPVTIQGPGTDPGATIARPGGGISPGSSAPGGTPNYTQAVPNGQGMLETQNPAHTAPAPITSAFGAAPMDVMNRVADQIRAKHPWVREVRFVTEPADAVRLATIEQDLRDGQAGDRFRDELSQMFGRSVPAGTQVINPNHPPQGTERPKTR